MKSSAAMENFIVYMNTSDFNSRFGFQEIIKKLNPAKYFNYFLESDFFGFEKIIMNGALSYLKVVLEKGATKDIKEVINIMQQLTNELDNRNDFKQTDFSWRDFSELFAEIPIGLITSSFMSMFDRWVNQASFNEPITDFHIIQILIPKLLKKQSNTSLEKAFYILQKFTEILLLKDGNTEKIKLKLNSYSLKSLLRKENLNMFSACYNRLLNLFKERLEQISEKNDVSWMWRPAIEDHRLNFQWNDVENCFVESFRDTLQFWINNSEKSIMKKYIHDLLNSKTDIIRRIAIYTVHKNFNECGKLLKKIIKTEDFTIKSFHELYELIDSKFEHLSKQEKQAIFNKIKNLKILNENSSGDSENLQFRWLQAIYNKGYDKADKLFDSLKMKIHDANNPHPSFIYYIESLPIDNSPYNELELINFAENGKIINKLNSFSESRNAERSYTIIGVIQAF